MLNQHLGEDMNEFISSVRKDVVENIVQKILNNSQEFLKFPTKYEISNQNTETKSDMTK